MAAKAFQTNADEQAAAGKRVLNVLLLYEDFGTALRAKRSLDGLPARLSLEAGLRTTLWRLDLLDEPLLKEIAAIEAAAADIIILSLHGHGGLRVAAREWLNRWLDHKEDRPYALAVLLDPETADSGLDNPVMAFAKGIAEAAAADLFCSSGPVPTAQAC